MPRLTQQQLNRAHAELVEHGVVFLEDEKDVPALIAQLPATGRPYFAKGRRVSLGSSRRETREERIGSTPPRLQ
jgi:hypothetical protein